MELKEFLYQMINDEDVKEQYAEQSWIHNNKKENLEEYINFYSDSDTKYYREVEYGDYVLRRFGAEEEYNIYALYYCGVLSYVCLDCNDGYSDLEINVFISYDYVEKILYLTEQYEYNTQLYIYKNGEYTRFNMDCM